MGGAGPEYARRRIDGAVDSDRQSAGSAQHYGVDVRIGWNPDTFGYNWQLPQIYKKSGIDYFVTQKMSWNDTKQAAFQAFLVAIA